MRYFLLKPDKRYPNVPEVINWYQKEEAGRLLQGAYDRLPRRMLFPVKGDRDIQFFDMLFHPFFVISNPIKKVLELYEPHYFYKEIIYLNQKAHQAEEYFLPILPKISCLTEDSQYNLDHSMVTKAVIDPSKVGDVSLFQLQEVKNRQMVIRLDLAESLLRRKAKGFLLEEACIRREAGE